MFYRAEVSQMVLTQCSFTVELGLSFCLFLNICIL